MTNKRYSYSNVYINEFGYGIWNNMQCDIAYLPLVIGLFDRSQPSFNNNFYELRKRTSARDSKLN